MSIKNISKVLVIGDVMLDIYISGTANRLSPEAPVPVLQVHNEYCVLGGAANVANNLSGLGINCGVFGFKGEDQNSIILDNLFKDKSIDNLTFTSSVPTITKTRIVAQKQQIVRLDREINFNNPIIAKQAFEKIITKFKNSYLIISDYAKGLCSQEFLSYVFLQSKVLNIKVFVDPKGNKWEKYKGAFLVKPNVKELCDIIGFEIDNEDDAIALHGRNIMKIYNIENLLITRSEKGMTLLRQNDIMHFHSEAKEVYDVSGAGDTVISTLVTGLIEGNNIFDATKLANKAAGIVVGKFGTANINKKELHQ